MAIFKFLFLVAMFGGVYTRGVVINNNSTSSLALTARATSVSSDGLLIDTFNDPSVNALGLFHGLSGDVSFGEFQETGTYLQVRTGNVDASFVTALAEGCTDWTRYKNYFVHIKYSGSAKFSISLQQHNKDCDDAKLPFPETWDSLEAGRYSSQDGSDIYIPVSHFHVNLGLVNGLALENWYTQETTMLYRIELLPAGAVPQSAKTVTKLDSGTLRVSCTQPNMIAFGIDDGAPQFLQRTLQIIKDEQIPVTFFVQGSALQLGPEDGNFTAGYREMKDLGHQFGLHSMTHPHMEAVQDIDFIDKEIVDNIATFQQKLGVKTKYLRPPYGTLGARSRQAVGRHIPNAELVLWSIDVKDWVYGSDPRNDPDRMQYKAFADQLKNGGDIVVLHYLYQSTVDQLRDMVRLAKSIGRQFVRMDQCIGDKDAPETWGWKRGQRIRVLSE